MSLASARVKADGLRWKTKLRYTLKGLATGVAVMLFGWFLELQERELPFTLASIIEIHRSSLLIPFLDLAPLLFSFIGFRMGAIQARVLASNVILEDKVRERTEEILLEKARTTAILDNAADSIVAFDDAGTVSLFNKAAEKLFGYTEKEVIGRNIRALLPVFAQSSNNNFVETIRLRKEDASPTSSVAFEALRKDGTTYPVEIDISETVLGVEVSFVVIIRDLSERRRVERLEQSLLAVTEAANSSQDLEELYRAIYDSLGQVLDVTNFYIALLEPDRKHYRVVFSVDESFSRPTDPIPIEQSILKKVVEAGASLLLTAADYEELVRKGELRRGKRPPSVSWLGVPLISNREVVGMMAVHSHEDGVVYTKRDQWIMNFVSSQIANAIERESARESLRMSERRYRRMVEEAGDIVFSTDLSGKFLYANPAISKLTGYLEEELIGQKTSLLLPDDWKPRVRAFYQKQLLERRRESVYEFEIVTKSGERRWIEQNTTLLEEDGTVIGFQGIVHDITERREAEAALREREARFRSLSASSPIGVFQLDARGECVYTNKRWQEITGRKLDQSLGHGWLESIHPDERETFRIEWVFSREEPTTNQREARVLRPDGDIRWVNIRWVPTTDENGKITGEVGTFEDITDRKQTEDLNKALYEIANASQLTDDFHQFCVRLRELLSDLVDTRNFYIALYDNTSQRIEFPFAFEGDTALRLESRPLGRGLTSYVIRTGHHLLIDEEGMERLYQSGEVIPAGRPTKNWLGVPLKDKGVVIGAVVLQSYESTTHYDERAVQTLNFVSTQIASAVIRKKAEEERKRYTEELAKAHNRIKDDLRLAARVQKSRLPQERFTMKGAEFAWLFDACEEVAGDMFNFIRLSETRVGIYVLDVSGHGVPAALLSMALSRSLSGASDGSGALLRERSGQVEELSPPQVASIMNDRYPMNLEINQYFTFLYGILDTAERTFRFTRAGHPAPVLVHRDGVDVIDEACGPAIGIIPKVSYEETVVELSPGDRLILYTDGIDEALNPDNEQFGLARIVQSLSLRHPTIEGDVKALRRAVLDFAGPREQSDDITVIGFQLSDKET